MAEHDSTGIAQLPAETLIATAEALIRAGQSVRAADLLDAAATNDERARARLTLAAARAAVDTDYRTGTALAPARLSAAAEAVAATESGALRWDLALVEVQHSYFDALFDGPSTPRFGPAGRDPQQVSDLQASAKRLYDDSPDTGRRGWASVLQGWIADNVAGDRGSAPAHYREALHCAEYADDDYLAFEALRHLGDHDHDDGEQARARERWERATRHAAAAGAVPGTLAQQILLAVTYRDTGDEAGAQALAREVERWAGAIGATRLQSMAQGFIEGVDPTAPPPGVDG